MSLYKFPIIIGVPLWIVDLTHVTHLKARRTQYEHHFVPYFTIVSHHTSPHVFQLSAFCQFFFCHTEHG